MALKDKYLTISEFAKELGVTRQTVSRWIKGHKLSAEKIGREVLIKKRELSRFPRHKLSVMFAKEMDVQFIKFIRSHYGYSEDDKIEPIGDDFVVTKSDGTCDVVQILEGSITVDIDESTRVGAIKITVKNVKREPYKQSSENKKGGK